jgi:hypothetical protein
MSACYKGHSGNEINMFSFSINSAVGYLTALILYLNGGMPVNCNLKRM